MTIGSRIAQLRRSKGFTQEYIADQLGVSRQAVSKWEQDQTSPDTKNLIALAQLLDTSIEYIASGKEADADKVSDRKLAKATVNAKVSTGNALLVIGFITLFLIPLLGIILLIVGWVYLNNARHLDEAIRPAPKPAPPAVLPPWVCYTCGHENEGRVQYCIECQTSKGWSEEKQLEKRENL